MVETLFETSCCEMGHTKFDNGFDSPYIMKLYSGDHFVSQFLVKFNVNLAQNITPCLFIKQKFSVFMLHIYILILKRFYLLIQSFYC